MRSLLLFIMIISTDLSSYAQTADVTVKGIRSGKGELYVAVFRDNESFRDNKAVHKYKYKKKDIHNGTLKLTVELEPGVYGLSLLDDENSNKKMDFNMIGIPKEGYGFSDFYHNSLSRPQFDDFKFTIKEGETKKIEMRVRYL